MSLLTSSNPKGSKPVPVAFPTASQNPSELAAVVSYWDDYIEWGRIEVKLAFRVLLQASSEVFNVGTGVGRETDVLITLCFT